MSIRFWKNTTSKEKHVFLTLVNSYAVQSRRFRAWPKKKNREDEKVIPRTTWSRDGQATCFLRPPAIFSSSPQLFFVFISICALKHFKTLYVYTKSQYWWPCSPSLMWLNSTALYVNSNIHHHPWPQCPSAPRESRTSHPQSANFSRSKLRQTM